MWAVKDRTKELLTISISIPAGNGLNLLKILRRWYWIKLLLKKCKLFHFDTVAQNSHKIRLLSPLRLYFKSLSMQSAKIMCSKDQITHLIVYFFKMNFFSRELSLQTLMTRKIGWNNLDAIWVYKLEIFSGRTNLKLLSNVFDFLHLLSLNLNSIRKVILPLTCRSLAAFYTNNRSTLTTFEEFKLLIFQPKCTELQQKMN